MPCISYWVISASELVARWSGMSSVSGSRLMTTPAACVEALRATPSSWLGEPDQPLDLRVAVVHLLELRATSRAPPSSLMPSWFGTAFAIRSTSP